MLHSILPHSLRKLNIKVRIIRLCKYSHVGCASKLCPWVFLRRTDNLEFQEVELIKQVLPLQTIAEHLFPQLPLLFGSIARGINDKLGLIATSVEYSQFCCRRWRRATNTPEMNSGLQLAATDSFERPDVPVRPNLLNLYIIKVRLHITV